MGVWLGPMGGKFKKATDYTFSGTSEFYADGNGNWEIFLKTGGNFRFRKNPGNIDVFIVGAGDGGDEGYTLVNESYSRAFGGSGGASGEALTYSNVSVNRGTIYPIQIGDPSTADIDTTGFGKTALGWAGESGATGAMRGGNNDAGASDAGAVTGGSKAFGESGTHFGGNTLFGSPGGGGGAAEQFGYNSKSPSGNGGSANPYTSTANDGGNATANTGNGGGGGGAILTSSYGKIKGDGGDGATGCIIIRNHRGS